MMDRSVAQVRLAGAIFWAVFGWIGLGWAPLFAAEPPQGRLQKCEASIKSYLAYEAKGMNVLHAAAPQGSEACRNAVGDIEQTTILIAPECGSIRFESYSGSLKSSLSKVKDLAPADTVLEVISKARQNYIQYIKTFCGMNPPPAGVSQDAADCSWFIEIQMKPFKSLNSEFYLLALDAPRICYQRLEEIKRAKFQIPEGCRRYTLESFPGQAAKNQMLEFLADSIRAPAPSDLVADVMNRVREKALQDLRTICDRRRK